MEEIMLFFEFSEKIDSYQRKKVEEIVRGEIYLTMRDEAFEIPEIIIAERENPHDKEKGSLKIFVKFHNGLEKVYYVD